ncbi:MAG: hypothetical protein KKA73_02940 [Chloroflexi bacterium]|nr:hypothetical protein [Chloroflexota bacterium]MBU1746620.1 hypothetical protein [Chloroflexota bacterium]MBU1877494.1 hypothetical protein [Chloroflexota bacterium]
MSIRWTYACLVLLLVTGALTTTACCPIMPPSTPTVRTATPWVVVETATPSPAAPPTVGPAPTATPVIPPTGVPTPVPTQTVEPNKPAVGIVAPPQGAQFSVGQPVPVQYTASDAQSGISRVELYADNNPVASQDYGRPPSVNGVLAWTANSPGSHQLMVKAIDGTGNWAPAYVNVTVVQNVGKPSVQITNPQNNATLEAGVAYNVVAVIQDEVGIRGLELLDGDATVNQNWDHHQTPYTWQVQWQSNQTGPHTLTVRAHDANDQNSVGSQSITVYIADRNPPMVNASYNPPGDVQEGSSLGVHVEAHDSKGVVQITLYVDNNQVDQWNAPNPDGQSSVGVDLAWHNVPQGGHTAYVQARDSTGLTNAPDYHDFQVVARPTPPPPPTQPAGPSAMGKWGAQSGDQRFLLIVTNQQGNTLQGTIQIAGQTVPISNSTIQGNQVEIHAQVGSVIYNFFGLALTETSMSGQWSTSLAGIPQPITFNRLLGQ